MSAPTKLFLKLNTIDHRWKVVDEKGFCFGDGKDSEEAVQSARIVSDAPIYGPGSVVISNPKEDPNLFNVTELIEELANLAGMKVIRAWDNDFKPCGYYMELVE